MNTSKNIKVSVLTYVKNDAAHIERCMRSVMAQNMLQMEYLVIDGGSTDGTREIIEQLSKEDSRIRVIDSAPGLGHQCNTGIKAAVGEYIGICESDDYLLPGMYEYQYEIAHQEQVDILRADAYDFWNRDGREQKILFRLPGVSDIRDRLLCEEEAEQAVRMGVNRFFSGLYRRKFLMEQELFMNETPGAAYQDNTFAFLTLIRARRIYISSKAFYCYRLDNPNASCNAPARLNMVDTEYRLLQERLVKIGEWERQKERYFSWMVLNHLWFCNLLSGKLLDQEVGIFYHAVKDLIDGDTFADEKLRSQDIDIIRAVQTSQKDFNNMVYSICEQIEHAKNDILALKPHEKIVIFGAGNIGRLVFMTLEEKGIRPICFMDNNRENWGTRIENVDVLPPETARTYAEDVKYIVANVEHNAEIREQLITYGIRREQMIVCDSYDYTVRKILMGA